MGRYQLPQAPSEGKQLTEAVAVFDRFVAEHGSPTRHLFSSFLKLGWAGCLGGNIQDLKITISGSMHLHRLNISHSGSWGEATSEVTWIAKGYPIRPASFRQGQLENPHFVPRAWQPIGKPAPPCPRNVHVLCGDLRGAVEAT